MPTGLKVETCQMPDRYPKKSLVGHPFTTTYARSIPIDIETELSLASCCSFGSLSGKSILTAGAWAHGHVAYLMFRTIVVAVDGTGS